VSRLTVLAKKIIGWVFVSLGICLGIFGLAILDSIWGHSDTASGRFELLSAFLFGFISLLASVIAIRTPRRAGLLLLFCSPIAFAAFFLIGIDDLRYGRMIWYDWLRDSFLFTLVLFVPGVFWLGTNRLNWLPLLARRESAPFRRRMLRFAGMGVMLLSLVWAAAIALAILTRPFAIDCNKRSTISRLGRGQVVFVGKVIGTLGSCVHYSGHQMCDGAIAIVQERFWGIGSRLALLTQGYFENGQKYLLDGVHLNGPLTRFLPIIGFRPCNHSAQLKDAQVDLRVLRDRSSPGAGVRIIGSVVRYNGKGREPVSGRTVIVAGPAGTMTLTTDALGIYDVSGLPPGRYEIHAEPRGSRSIWHTQCGSTGYELRLGDIGGCELDVE